MANNNFDDKLNQIKKLLEDENMAKTLSGIIDSISSPQKGTPPPTNNPSEDFPETEDFNDSMQQAPNMPPPPSTGTPSAKSTLNELGGSIDAFNKISQIYSEMNRTDSPSVNLLLAVKPYLNSNRQSRLDRAAKVLNLSKLPNMMREFGKD